MLAIKRSTKKSFAPRSGAPGDSLLALALRRVGAFALARPGSVALMLLFGALAVAVSTNALWMQSDRHPAPLFRQASLAPQHAVAPTRKAAEPPASSASSSLSPQEGEAALPPSRSVPLAHGEGGSPMTAKPQPTKHAERDPLADLIAGQAPVPPASLKLPAPKQQTAEKAPHASTPANDAIAGLIEQSAKGR